MSKIISITIANGDTSGTNTVSLDAGIIDRVICYSSKPTANHNNPGMVRAEIKVNGRQIQSSQPIDNFRSKDVAFEQDGLPIDNIGGALTEINVDATQAFTADTELDFVFVYRKQIQN